MMGSSQSEKLFKKILDSCFKVHTALGPGLLESAYEKCLVHELSLQGLRVEEQKPMPLLYEGLNLDAGYRIDLFVESEIVIEIKAVEAIAPVHLAQILTYLKLSEKPLGLLVNFNVKHLKEGIKRVILSKN